MIDLDTRLESAANAMHRAVGNVTATRFAAEHRRYQGHETRRPQRRVGLVAACVVTLLGVAGLVLLERRPAVEPADQAASVSSTPISVATVPTMRPLELGDAPEGLKLVGQGVRPAAEDDLYSAVFVKRGAHGDVVDRAEALGALPPPQQARRSGSRARGRFAHNEPPRREALRHAGRRHALRCSGRPRRTSAEWRHRYSRRSYRPPRRPVPGRGCPRRSSSSLPEGGFALVVPGCS